MSQHKLQDCNVNIRFLDLPYFDVSGPQELDLNSQAAQTNFLSNQSTGQFFANLQERCKFLHHFSAGYMLFFPRNSDLQHFTFLLSQTTCHIHFLFHFHLVTQTRIRAAILLRTSYPQFVYYDSSALLTIFFPANKVTTEVFHNRERIVSESDAGKHSC